MATKVMECDLVVLGAGGVGMPTAVKAAEDSGKKVIILEKAKKLGGGAMFMHAFPIRDSKWQKDAGETVSNPPDLSGQFFDWLVSKGGAEEYWKVYKPTDVGSGFFGTVHMFKRTAFYKDLPDVSIGPGGTGTYIIDKMRECCDKMGIPVITQARGKKLLVGPEGKVTGVVADTPDGELQVNSKAVFIATGGFGGDYKRLQKLFPVDFNNEPFMCLCPRSNTGDGIDMAQAVGAHIDLENAGVSFAGGVHHPYNYSIFCMILNKNNMKTRPELLLVKLDGERWSWPVSTGGQQDGFDASKHAAPASAPAGKPQGGGGMPKYSPSPVSSLPGGAFYAVLDQHIAGILGEKVLADEFDERAFPFHRKWQEDLDYEASIDDSKVSHGNHVKKADTLEELALKMNVDPKVFMATVKRYNQLCDEGKDADFGKDPSALIPLRNPPYYALYAHRFSQMTRGGIITNASMEVLDTKGNPIPGLYAGGCDATSQGGPMARAQVQGWYGGTVVAKYLKSLG